MSLLVLLIYYCFLKNLPQNYLDWLKLEHRLKLLVSIDLFLKFHLIASLVQLQPICNIVDAEIFVGEIVRGLNFQEIQFSWMVVPRNFGPNENFCLWKISMQVKMAKAVTQYQISRRLSRIKARTFWEAAFGETVVCVLVPGNFHDRNAIAIEKDGRIIAGHLPRKVSRVHSLFLKIAWWNCSLHCDWKTVGKTATCSRWLTDYSTYLYSCNLPYHFSSIFHCTNYSLI